MAGAYVRDRAPEGELGARGFTAYKVACALFDFGLTGESVLEHLHDWNDTKCDPPMDVEGNEGLEHARDSASRNMQNAKGAKHRDAPHGFDAVDPGPDRRTPRQVAADTPASNRKQPRRRILTFGEACAMAFSDTGEPLVEGVINCNELSVMYGKFDTGKSFVHMDMDYHIAAGRPWFGREVKQGAVLYVAAEGGNGATRRFEALRQRYGDTPPLFIVMGQQDLFNSHQDLGVLIDGARAVEAQHGCKIIKVSIDTVAKVMAGGNDSSAQDMNVLAANFQEIQEAIKCHVAAIHHAGHTPGRPRGSTAFPAAIETVIEISGDGKITIEKQKEGVGHFVLGKFRIVGKQIGIWARTGKPMTSATIESTVETFTGEAADANAPMPLPGNRNEQAEKLYWALKAKADAEHLATTETAFTSAQAGEWMFGGLKGLKGEGMRRKREAALVTLKGHKWLAKSDKNTWRWKGLDFERRTGQEGACDRLQTACAARPQAAPLTRLQAPPFLNGARQQAVGESTRELLQ